MRKSNRTVWIISFIILIVLALFGLMRSPVFSLRHIEVVGNQEVPATELIALTNVGIGTNIFQISPTSVAKSVMLHPLIESAKVSCKLPDTLLIQVVERKPIAMIPVQSGFVKVDRQGVFLKRDDVWPKDPLPIISGVKIPDNLNLGQPINNPALIQAIEILLSMPADLYPQIGELSAANQDQLVLYTRDGLEIRLGEADKAAKKFSVLRQFLADKNYAKYRIGYYVDLTSGQPVLGRR